MFGEARNALTNLFTTETSRHRDRLKSGNQEPGDSA